MCDIYVKYLQITHTLPPMGKSSIEKTVHIATPTHKSKKKSSGVILRDVKMALKTIQQPFLIKALSEVEINKYLDILLTDGSQSQSKGKTSYLMAEHCRHSHLQKRHNNDPLHYYY